MDNHNLEKKYKRSAPKLGGDPLSGGYENELGGDPKTCESELGGDPLSGEYENENGSEKKPKKDSKNRKATRKKVTKKEKVDDR